MGNLTRSFDEFMEVLVVSIYVTISLRKTQKALLENRSNRALILELKNETTSLYLAVVLLEFCHELNQSFAAVLAHGVID